MKHLLHSLALRVTMLIALLVSFGSSVAWADDVTFTPGTDTGETSVTKSPITATMTTMNNASYYQIYANGSGTFSTSDGNITKIEFTCTASGTSKYGPGNASANVGSYSYSGNTGTWTGNATSVTISSTAQIRMSSLVITYASSKTATTLSLSPTSVTLTAGGATQTITPTVSHAGGTVSNPTITWQSSNNDIATVSGGVVTPVASGICTITASYAGDATYAAADDATCSITVNSASKAATPTFSVSGGTYKTPQSVTISSTDASYIYYTTNGDDPTADGVTPIEVEDDKVVVAVNSSMTIKARGIDDELEESNLASVTYTIKPDAPSFSVAAGTYEASQTVSLSQAAADGIYYTLDGSDPTSSNTAIEYSEPINVSSNTTIKAAAYVGDFAFSDVAEAVYTIVTDETYVQVTNISDLATDDVVTFVNESAGNALGAYRSDKSNYGVGSVSISNHSFTIKSNTTSVTRMTIEKDLSYFYFKLAANSYIGAGSSKSNYMKPAGEKGNNQKATVSISSGNATITFQGTYTHNLVSYNPNNGNPLFSCYTSSQSPVQIYKRVIVEDAELAFASSTANATYGSAFSGPALTNEHSASLTWTSSNEDVATVASDGTITLVAAGETTITATATGMYTGSDSYTLTVARASTSLAFAASTAKTYVGESTYQQTASIAPAAADNTIAYSFSGEHGDATINTSNGTVTFNGFTGNLTIQASAAQTDKYAAPETVSYTLTVSANPTATLALSSTSESTTYGTNVVLDGTFADGYLDEDDADVIGTGYNSSIADFSFDKGTGKITITPAAVGSTTFTFKADAVGDYEEGSTVNFTLSVNEPVAKTSSIILGDALFYESFDSNTGTANNTGGNDGNWNGASATFKTNQTGWSVTNGYGADRCVRIGKSGESGSLTSPSITVEEGKTYQLTYKAAPWSTDNTHVTVEVTGGDISGIGTDNMAKQQWNEYEGLITATGTSIQITFSASRFFLDEVTVRETSTPTVSATIPSSGIGTYCSEYPLTFDATTDETVKAYAVDNFDVEEAIVTLTKIHGDIAGGTPMILKGEANSNINLTPATSGSAYAGANLLVGTLAPTYVTATAGDDTNFAMSGGVFKKLNTGVLPAHKAYLQLPTAELPSAGSVKEFTLRFVDITTGITETVKISADDAEKIFNLGGQRMSKMQRGINIVNGKKVLVK